MNEALHTTEEEYALLADIMNRIKAELQSPVDDMQSPIVIDYIGLLLNYCKRFYDRQFMTRKMENVDVLNRFRSLLDEYYENKLQLKQGIPTVGYCADKMCMSAGYFGDMVKRFTGESAIGYIHRFVIQKAKDALSEGNSVANVAYDLGFDYPQHFSRLFKRKAGITPSEYIAGIKGRLHDCSTPPAMLLESRDEKPGCDTFSVTARVVCRMWIVCYFVIRGRGWRAVRSAWWG
ncbi:MAG: helix-turn-helix domain-containing protein [Muribaculaceae bacterium]